MFLVPDDESTGSRMLHSIEIGTQWVLVSAAAYRWQSSTIKFLSSFPKLLSKIFHAAKIVYSNLKLTKCR